MLEFTSATLETRVIDEIIKLGLNLDLFLQWKRIHGYYFPSKEVLSLPLERRIPTILLRQYQNCFHNLVCKLRVKVLEDDGSSVSCTEFYEELLNIEQYVSDLDQIPRVVGSQMDSDIIVHDGTKEYKEEIKTTLGHWTQSKKDAVSHDSAEMLFVDLTTLPTQLDTESFITLGSITGSITVLFQDAQQIMSAIKRVLPAASGPKEVLLPGVQLEEELDGEAIDGWYEALSDQYNLPDWRKVLKTGDICNKLVKETEKLLLEEKPPLSEFAFLLDNNHPAVWEELAEKLKPSQTRQDKKCGGSYFLYWDHEVSELPFEEQGNPTNFYHEMQDPDVKRKGNLGITVTESDYRFNPGLKELHYSGMYKTTDKVPSRGVKEDIWWTQREVDEAKYCADYWKSHCSNPIAKGVLPELISESEWDELPVCNASEDLKTFITRACKTKMMSLMWLNNVIARIVVSHKYVGGVNLRKARVGPGSYIYWTGKRMNDTISMARGTFVKELPPGVATLLSRDVRVYECTGGYYIWESWRRVQVSDLEAWLSFPKTIVTITTLISETLSPDERVPNMSLLLEDWVYLCFLFLTTKDESVRNCKPWTAIIAGLDNDYVSLKTMLASVPSTLPTKIEAVFWSKLYHWLIANSKSITVPEKNIVLVGTTSKVEFKESQYPPIFIRCCHQDKVVGRIIQSRLGMILNRTLKSTLSVKQRLAGKYARMSLDEHKIDKDLQISGQRLAIPDITSPSKWVQLILAEMTAARDIYRDHDARVCTLVRRPATFLFLGALWTHNDRERLKVCHKNLGVYEGMTQPITKNLRNSSGITRGNPRSMHQAALTLVELELDPTSYIRSQFVNNIAREKPLYVSSKINQKEGERYKKEREFQSERQMDYELNNLMNLFPRAVKTNIITNNQDKTLQQQQMYDNVLADAAKMKKKYKEIVPIMAVSDIKQWSPRKDDSELVWFLIPTCSYMNSSEVKYNLPKICKVSLCSIMQTLERRSFHGITMHTKKGLVDWLESPNGDHLQDKIMYRLAIARNDDIFDKQVHTHFSSTMGKTHPIATQMQDIKYKFLMQWSLRQTGYTSLSRIRCLTSADDIVVCFVATTDIDAVKVCQYWTDLALIFGAEEVSADKTYLSKAGRGEFLGTPTDGFRFIPEKLTSSAGHVGLSSFDPSLGCALSSLMGACQRSQLTGLSTSAAYCTLLVGKAWLTWALDLAPRTGSLWEEVKEYLKLDLPSGFKVPYISFPDFASGQTLSELELSQGSNMFREYYTYIGALDPDFVVVPYNPALKADLPKLSALNGLNIPLPRSRQPQTELVVTRFIEKYGSLTPYSDMDGIDLAFSRGDSIEDVGFSSALPSLLTTRGLYRRSNKLDLIGSYYRLRLGKCVKLRHTKVTMKEAYSIYINRTKQSDTATNAGVCARILDHVFPEHIDKQHVANCTVPREWICNPALKLVKISSPPRLFRCAPDEISFFITYGAALCQVIRPRSSFKDLTVDAKKVLNNYPQAPSLGHSILSSLITPPIPPPFVACTTTHGGNINYHTALRFACLDNVWGGYGVMRDEGIILGKVRRGYDEMDPISQEIAAKFILTACTACPSGTANEYITRLETALVKGDKANMVITRHSQYCSLYSQLLRDRTISSTQAFYKLPYGFLCTLKQELLTWYEEESYAVYDPVIYTKQGQALACTEGSILITHPLVIKGTYRFCNCVVMEIVRVIGSRTLHVVGAGYAWDDVKKKIFSSSTQIIDPTKVDLTVQSQEDEALISVEPGLLITTTFKVELTFYAHVAGVDFEDRVMSALIDTNVFDLKLPKGDLRLWQSLFPDAKPQTLLKSSYYLSLLSGTGSSLDLTSLTEGSLWIPADPSNVVSYLHTPGSVISMVLMKDTIHYMELLPTEDLIDGTVIGILHLIKLSNALWILGKQIVGTVRDRQEKKLKSKFEFTWRATVSCALTYRKRTGVGLGDIKQLVLNKGKTVLARIHIDEELPFSLRNLADDISDVEWFRLSGDVNEILNTNTDFDHFLEIEGISGVSFIPNLNGETYLENKERIWWADELYYIIIQAHDKEALDPWDEDWDDETDDLPSWAQLGQ